MPGVRFNARANAPTPQRTAYPISVRSATGPGTPMRTGSVQPASLVRASQARAGAGENTNCVTTQSSEPVVRAYSVLRRSASSRSAGPTRGYPSGYEVTPTRRRP